ncbi:MAG: hypothetical protein ACRYFX_19275 [Janthinobacterium lividum]
MQHIYIKFTWFTYWIAPLIIGLSCFYFFPILGWLTRIEHQPEQWMKWDDALTVWTLPMLALIGSGFIVNVSEKNKIFTLIYVILGLWFLFLVALVGAASSISPKT